MQPNNIDAGWRPVEFTVIFTVFLALGMITHGHAAGFQPSIDAALILLVVVLPVALLVRPVRSQLRRMAKIRRATAGIPVRRMDPVVLEHISITCRRWAQERKSEPALRLAYRFLTLHHPHSHHYAAYVLQKFHDATPFTETP